MSKKNKKLYFIILIIFIFLIAILLSVFLIKSNTGDAKRIMNSEGKLEQPANENNLLSSQKLTEFNIPTKEPLDNTSISQTFKENIKFELKLDNPIIALSVTGNATLLSEAGVIRIILIDDKQNEYLVYEIDNLLANNSKEINFENACGETCVLDQSITVASIKIQTEEAILNLSSINSLSEGKTFIEIKDITSYKQEISEKQSKAKIEKYNSSQNSWRAGETSVSRLPYADKIKLFRNEDGTYPNHLPNLQGFLYYKGGIFILKKTREQQAKSQDNITLESPSEMSQIIILPDSWDWRNVHEKNWNTPIKNQGPISSCGIMSLIGTMESQINLYYNQQLNIDLSEQAMLDCSSVNFPGYPYSIQECNGISGRSEYCRIAIHGIPEETCNPYSNRYEPNNPQNCANYLCTDWESRVWKNNFATSVFSLNENKKKNY